MLIPLPLCFEAFNVFTPIIIYNSLLIASAYSFGFVFALASVITYPIISPSINVDAFGNQFSRR